jgi:hypothetical protein
MDALREDLLSFLAKYLSKHKVFQRNRVQKNETSIYVHATGRKVAGLIPNKVSGFVSIYIILSAAL